MNDNNIYPNLLAIAEHYNVEVEKIESYQVWYSCFFVKITGIGWRFVSRTFTRTVIRVTSSLASVAKKVVNKVVRKGSYQYTLKEQKEWENSLFRVIKTWDNGSYWQGDRVLSVLVQNINCREKPWWNSVFLHQGINRGDILALGYGNRLVKTCQSN